MTPTAFHGDIVLLSTAEWANPFWTNKQHTALELARSGSRVFYIDSLGLRQPTATSRDLKRLCLRLLRAFRPPRQVASNLWVWSPLIVPAAHQPLIQLLNQFLLGIGLDFWLCCLGLKKTLLWTYSPITLKLLRREDYAMVVYHCVDDIASQPGMDARAIRSSEIQLCTLADLVFVTSQDLLASRGPLNVANTYYFPNVVDYEHFASCSRADDRGFAFKDLPLLGCSPCIGFVGAISSYKVDFQLLRHLAESKPDWSFVLIGSIGEGDPHTDASLLEGLANLHLVGPRRYQELPYHLAAFDVALIPAPMNAYTRAMFPMKFFEYLAAGVPVVATPLPALQEFGDCFLQASSPAGFAEAIQLILDGSSPVDAERCDQVARAYSYRTRTDWMLRHVGGRMITREPS